VWGMKVVDCHLCCGAGRLALEAFPPGESCFTVDLDCVACQGRGRLGVIDRWVLWKGWEQETWTPSARHVRRIAAGVGVAALLLFVNYLNPTVPQLLLSFWLTACVLMTATLVWSLRLVPCRLCGGEGRIGLDAQPPEEDAFHVVTDCVGCEGSG